MRVVLTLQWTQAIKATKIKFKCNMQCQVHDKDKVALIIVLLGLRLGLI